VPGSLSEQPPVAFRRTCRVAQGLQPPQLDAALDDRAHLRFAFGLVGVEQVVGHPARQDQVQLEREVPRVPHARAHALAEKRRHLMCRVPREHGPASSPAVGDHGPEHVSCHPDEVRVTRREVPGDALPYSLRLALDLKFAGGAEHEAEPVVGQPE
jgi:hypothetical protein